MLPGPDHPPLACGQRNRALGSYEMPHRPRREHKHQGLWWPHWFDQWSPNVRRPGAGSLCHDSAQGKPQSPLGLSHMSHRFDDSREQSRRRNQPNEQSTGTPMPVLKVPSRWNGRKKPTQKAGRKSVEVTPGRREPRGKLCQHTDCQRPVYTMAQCRRHHHGEV